MSVSFERRNTVRCCTVFLILVFLFCAAIVFNINTGSVNISVGQILRIIFLRDASTGSTYNIIWKIRLPRLLLAAILGGALSLSGYLLQTFFRNHIAGPFVLGISSGAKMFLTLVTIGLSSVFTRIPVSVTVLAAFVGSMLFVLIFAGRIKNMSMLLVIGIMILPVGMQRFYRTSNHIERLNKELKRRSKVIGIFPNEKSLLRMMGSVRLNAIRLCRAVRLFSVRLTTNCC